MKTFVRFPLLAAFLSLTTLVTTSSAQVPQLVNYQGRVIVAGTNFSGAGQFKFALVNSNGIPTFWSNNGSSVNGSEPGADVSLTVANGLYSVLLGDATLANMTVIPATVFTNADVRLRVWFNGGSGFQLLTPDQRIAAVGYAMMSANVPDGVITASKLADGAVTASKIADAAVTGAKIAAGSVTSNALSNPLAVGSSSVNGSLHVYRNATGTPGISLLGGSSQISTYGSDGLEQIRLWGGSYGELILHNSLPNNATAVTLTAQGSTGGRLTLNNTNGSNRAILEGENVGGTLTLYQADGGIGTIIYGNEGAGAGAISLRNTNGSARVRIYGQSPDTGGGEISVNGDAGTEVVELKGNSSGGQIAMRDETGTRSTVFLGSSTVGGYEYLYNGSGLATVYLDGDSGGGGYVSIRNTNGSSRVVIDGQSTSGGGGIFLYNGAGANTVSILGESSGNGKVTTQVLQITGGADLSENFEINAERNTLQPGMIVSIDPQNAGELTLSRTAYDKKVAGIVSGAGGVKTGMLMGQAGTKADGTHPVALTGRVYCWVDADAAGAVEPGDLLTTSGTPGHGMKANESSHATGAIIGKAMTSLAKGKGLVLVLVSLQ